MEEGGCCRCRSCAIPWAGSTNEWLLPYGTMMTRPISSVSVAATGYCTPQQNQPRPRGGRNFRLHHNGSRRARQLNNGEDDERQVRRAVERCQRSYHHTATARRPISSSLTAAAASRGPVMGLAGRATMDFGSSGCWHGRHGRNLARIAEGLIKATAIEGGKVRSLFHFLVRRANFST